MSTNPHIPPAWSASLSAADLIEHVRKFERLLRAHVRRYLHNSADIDEVIQEVYAKLIASGVNVPDIRSLLAYCLIVSRNAAIDRLRHLRRIPIEFVPDVETLAEADDCAHVERIVAGSQELELLVSFVETLPPLMRRAYTLRVVYSLKHSEIAEHLKISTNCVQHMLRVAARLSAQAMEIAAEPRKEVP